jgi:hypothetical protein
VTSTFDAAQLGTCATAMMTAGAALDASIDTFLAAVDSIGEPSGSREPIGMLLGAGIAAATDTLVESLQTVVDGFERVSGSLEFMSAADAQTESDNNAAVAAIPV